MIARPPLLLYLAIACLGGCAHGRDEEPERHPCDGFIEYRLSIARTEPAPSADGGRSGILQMECDGASSGATFHVRPSANDGDREIGIQCGQEIRLDPLNFRVEVEQGNAIDVKIVDGQRVVLRMHGEEHSC